MRVQAVRAVTAAALTVWGGAAAAENREASCAIQNLVVRVLAESEHFLHHLETGLYPEAPADLARRLDQISLVSLRSRMVESGFSDAAGAAERMVLQQRLVLSADRVEGRAAAAAAAQDLGVSLTLAEIRDHASAWPCFDSSRRFSGLKDAAPGGGSGRPAVSEELQAALFSTIATLLAGAGAYFWWRAKIDMRRTQRFSCWIPCTISWDAQRKPAFIANISRSGARIRTAAVFSPGQEVVLDFAGTGVAARVVRSTRRSSALHFTEKLSGPFLQAALDTYG